MPDAKLALIFDDDFHVEKSTTCDKCQGRNKPCLYVTPYYHATTICKDCLLQVIQRMDDVSVPSLPSSNSGG